MLHGTSDVLVAYGCAEKQRDAVRAAWGLAAEEVVSADDGHVRMRYTGPSGGVLEMATHDYAASSVFLLGHCYPGSDDNQGGEPGQLFGFACEGENAFHWGEEVMAFFLAHPREGGE